MNFQNENEIFKALAMIRSQGYAVVCFTPDELRGADKGLVEDRLIELGWDVIDALATELEDAQ